MTNKMLLKTSLLNMAILIGSAVVSAQTGGSNVPPAPHPATPDGSSFLSFGAAVVIGVGVFLLGRLRKERR